MPTATILEPLGGDTVTSPVTVVAWYDTASAFDMICEVDSVGESKAQTHPAGSDIHQSEAIATANSPVTVRAKDHAAPSPPLDEQAGVNVTSGPAPVEVEGVEEPTMAIVVAHGKRAKKKRKLRGQTDATATPVAAYVICQVYEVDITTHNRAVIAAGAGTVIKVGARRKWVVEIEFEMDTTDNTLQYIARITAYDKDGAVLGKTTKHLTK